MHFNSVILHQIPVTNPLQYLQLLSHPLNRRRVVILKRDFFHCHHLPRIIVHGRVYLPEPALAYLDAALPRERDVFAPYVIFGGNVRGDGDYAAYEVLRAQLGVYSGV